MTLGPGARHDWFSCGNGPEHCCALPHVLAVPSFPLDTLPFLPSSPPPLPYVASLAQVRVQNFDPGSAGEDTSALGEGPPRGRGGTSAGQGFSTTAAVRSSAYARKGQSGTAWALACSRFPIPLSSPSPSPSPPSFRTLRLLVSMRDSAVSRNLSAVQASWWSRLPKPAYISASVFLSLCSCFVHVCVFFFFPPFFLFGYIFLVLRGNFEPSYAAGVSSSSK